MENSDSLNPYCTLTLYDQTYKTKTIKRTTNPNWNTVFTFDLQNFYYEKYINGKIKVKIFGKEKIREPQLLGEFDVNLWEVPINDITEKYFQISDQSISAQILLQFDTMSAHQTKPRRSRFVSVKK